MYLYVRPNSEERCYLSFGVLIRGRAIIYKLAGIFSSTPSLEVEVGLRDFKDHILGREKEVVTHLRTQFPKHDGWQFIG